MLELALLVAGLAPPAAPGPAQDPADPAQALAAAFEAGRFDRALELADGLLDRDLAAEWRFHVLYHGGDLPGALAAVRTAQQAFPEHPRLLENGARCALALGLGEVAHEQARRLLLAPLDAAGQVRARELLAGAEELLERDRCARAGIARGRAVALALALAALAALWTLSRRAPVAAP